VNSGTLAVWCVALHGHWTGLKGLRLKDHRQRIPKKCNKTIFRKINTEETFLPFTVITNKDYFSRKKLKLRKFTVAVYVIYIYDRDRLDILSGANCEILLVKLFIY